jgi:hypothetical protein
MTSLEEEIQPFINEGLTPEKIDDLIVIADKYNIEADVMLDIILRYAAEIEEVKNESIREREKIWFKREFPAFSQLVDTYPDRFEEFKGRASLYVALVKAKEDFKFDEERADIERLMQALSSEPSNDFFRNNTLTTDVE